MSGPVWSLKTNLVSEEGGFLLLRGTIHVQVTFVCLHKDLFAGCNGQVKLRLYVALFCSFRLPN